jgi:phage shock protein PspC (stress-responsive transcriptional regulator)
VSTTQPQTEAQPPRPPRRRLERSRDERVLAGVCGGLARNLAIDPLLVRILAVASVVFAGFGVVAYLAAWLLMPEEGEQQPIIGVGRANRAVQVVGAVALGVIAIVAVASWADGSWWFGGGPLVFFLLAAAAVWLVSERDRRPGWSAPAPTAPVAPTAPAQATAETRAFGADAATETRALTDDDATAQTRAFADDDATAPTHAFADDDATAEASALADDDATAPTRAFADDDQVEGPTVAGPRRRRGARRALIVLAVVFSLGVAAAGALGTWLVLDGGVGARTYRVTDGDNLRGTYELGAGHLRLDVRDIALAKGTTHVDAKLHAGLLEVVAPGAHFDDGSAVAHDTGAGGIDVDRTIVVGSGHRALRIDAHVGAGEIEISDQPSDMSDWTVSDAAPGCRGLGFALLRPGCAASGA